MQRKVIIPIEMAARELDGKIMLAAELATVGYKVILAEKHLAMNYALSVTNSIFLSIWGAHQKFSDFYARVREKGSSVVAMDEEAFVTMGTDAYQKTRLTAQSLKNIDLFLCIGSWDASLIRKKAPAVNVATVGNPRVDVLLGRKRASCEEAGALLFVSPFGFANHFIGGQAYLKQLVDSGVLKDDSSTLLYTRYLNYQEQSMFKFMDFARHVASQLPERKIVYRCHPAEHRERVAKYFSDTKISVSRDASLINDLEAASVVVHNFCTVGLEAQILGKNTLAYAPLRFGVEDEEFVYRNSSVATNTESGMRELRKMLSAEHDPAKFDPGDRIFIPAGSSAIEISRRLKTQFGVTGETKSAWRSRKFLTFVIRQWARARLKGENPYFQSRKRGLSLRNIQSRLSERCAPGQISVRKLPLGDFFEISL